MPSRSAALNREIAGFGRAAAQDQGVELLTQPAGRHIRADGGIGDEPHPFLGQLIDPALDQVLVQLHVGMPYISRPPIRSARS